LTYEEPMVPTPRQVDEAVTYWCTVLRSAEVGPDKWRPGDDRIGTFGRELRAVLTGQSERPYAVILAREMLHESDVWLVCNDGPRGILAEAALAAGFSRELIAFPLDARMILREDGAVDYPELPIPVAA
jgi:hypothetical protein